MAAVRHLGFVKFKYFNGRSGQGNHFASYTKFHKDRSNSGEDIAIFVIFQDGGCRHLGFSTIPNFNGRCTERGQYESPFQISSKSVKRLQRCGDLMVFPKWRPSAILIF